jgi:glycosyltransferase involved in cell wall biosynthesis
MMFSVIVPIYNTRRFLPRCLDSILPQLGTEDELILVDDGSTDGCGELCDSYAERDGRLRVIHKPNGGLVSARNVGIERAVGEYVLYVDGDDWVLPNWLSVIRSRILSAPERPDVLVFGSVMRFPDHEDLNRINAPDGFYDRARLKAEIFPYLISDRRLFFGEAVFLPASWNKAYKRELLVEHHCMDECIRIGEDNAFVFECLLNAQSAVVCQDVLYCYNRENPDSILRRLDPQRFRKRLRLFCYVRERLNGYGPVIDRQLADFYARRIIFDMNFAAAGFAHIQEASRFIASEMDETRLLDFVRVGELPPQAKALFLLLRLRQYAAALLALRLLDRVIAFLRKKKKAV